MEINWFWQLRALFNIYIALLLCFMKSIKIYVYKFMFTNNIETTVHAYINVYILHLFR